MARCLVLGANGFIGSHVVDSLASKGHFVRCFDRYKSGDVTFLNHKEHDIEICSGDFLSQASLDAALENIDYVFHFISTTNPIMSENDPVIDIETNVKMSVELFKLCAKKNIKKVIFASTGGAIYGESIKDHPMSEDVQPKPISPYAIGKLTIENYLRYFKAKYELHYAVLRISNPYGPRQNTLSGQGVVSIFLEHIKNNKSIVVFGDGTMVRDYIYISDVADMIAQSFEKQSDGSVYNLGSGKGYSVNELVELIGKVTGMPIKTKTVPKPVTFVQNIVLDTTRFTKDFGITPSIDLEQGISKTWAKLGE